GIPVFCAKNSDILEKPILALITSALDAVSGGYAYDDVFRYLKTGLTDLSDEERDLLENYVLTWNIRGSKWTQKADWEMNPGGFGLGKKAGDQALLAQLNNIRRRVVLPLETLRKNQNKTGRGHALALYRFLQEIGLTKKLTERTEGLRARGQLRLAEEYSQLWDIVRGGLEQCALLLDSTAMELGEFARLLALVLSQYDVGTIPVSLDRVTAGECTRMGYRKIKVLLLLGCDDSAMPMAAPSPGLFTDDDRALLAELGLELAPSLEHKLGREMTIAYVAAATPTERLLVSYAQNSAAGEGQRPAFLLNRLRMLFPDLPLVYEEDTDAFRLAAPGPALELAGVRPEVREALAALPDYREKVERITRGLSLTRGQLSPKAVSALYGKKVPMSASRMDLYKSCHFSYFMQYGLKARPRERAGFEAPEYGTFMHDILEHVLQEKDFFGADEKTLKKLVAGAVRRYVDEDLGGLKNKTPRFRYLFNRLQRSVRQVVHNVAEELAASDFQPIAFELGFTENGALPPIEVQSGDLTISVTGFVDRVDGWQKDGKLYIRVVDYKTGYKSFDLTDIQNGMGLQMLLYLFTLEKEGKRLFGTDVTPAGVLYLPARDVVLPGNRSTTAGEQQKKQDTELRRKGLLLGDKEVLEAMEHPGFAGIRFLPIGCAKDGTFTGEALVDGQDWKKLGRHVEKVLGEIGKELASGTVDADPYWRSTEHNACRYCRYAAACQFEEEQGDCRRYLPTVKSEEFWKGLR
ncbi:MAG: PD-(D/E)XK nuclease family protein, partial [Oscillospiraceae bacterium]